MIKAEVNVIGTVSRTAVVRDGKEGTKFVTFGVSVVILAKSGINKTVEISVAKDYQLGDDISLIQAKDNRVGLKGTITFRKKGDNLYLNMEASEVNVVKPEDKDIIEGDMTFLGKVGNKIEVKDSKNGKKFLSISGFSTTKEGEDFEYTWVRFIQFEAEKPEWLVPKAGIEVKGKLELDVYNDKLDISCRVSELKEWVKQQ